MTFPSDALDVFAGLVVGVIVGAAIDRVIVREGEAATLARTLHRFAEEERRRATRPRADDPQPRSRNA